MAPVPTAPHDTPGRPDHAQEYLGRQLRLLRESRGISREVAGRHIGGSEPKISRMELGRNRVKEDDLDALLTLYGVVDATERQAMHDLACRLNKTQWWHQYSDVVTGWFCSYLVLESITETIRTYEARFIPGLLQTRAYANALVGMHYPDKEQARRRVEVRLRRRHTLLDQQLRPRAASRHHRPWLWAIIDESALHERIGHPDVMREQIDFLIDATRRLNTRIQILPTGTGGLTGVGNSFSLLPLPTKILPDVVYLEHLAGALFLDDPHEIEPYRHAMALLGTTALHPDDTITELEKAKRRMNLT
jgi:transcriptional regulator with XRE-family HTH domain